MPEQVLPKPEPLALDTLLRVVGQQLHAADRPPKTAADWRRYWGRGKPSAEDVEVLQALARDPRYRLVFYSPEFNQAVFRRVQ